LTGYSLKTASLVIGFRWPPLQTFSKFSVCAMSFDLFLDDFHNAIKPYAARRIASESRVASGPARSMP
jgi:hypothetical protein